MIKKRHLFIKLLLLVLMLNMINISFALPMKLVQRTTGEFSDVDKRFTYYIETNSAYINPNQENVEKIENVRFRRCSCGFMLLECQPNANEIWEGHLIECKSFNSYYNVNLNKITLKNGEEISINTIKDNPIIYAVQEKGYSISHSADGKNFINFVNDKNMVSSDLTLAMIKFTPTEDGILTLRRANIYVPNTGINMINCETVALISFFCIFAIILQSQKREKISAKK